MVADSGATPDSDDACTGAVAVVGQPVQIRPGLDFFDNDIYSPVVAVNDHGMAVVTWVEEIGDVPRVMASRLDNGCWDPPAELATDPGSSPSAVVADDGTITVVWAQRELDQGVGIAATTVHATSHRSGAWESAERISSDVPLDYTSYVYEPQIVLDDADEVVAVWTQSGGSSGVAWNRRGPDGWGLPGIVADDRILAAEAHIITASGDRMVSVWRERSDILSNDGVTNIFASYFDGIAWSVAESMGDPTLVDNDGVERLHLVARGDDGVTALWRQQSGGVISHQANHFDLLNSTWAGATPIPVIPGEALNVDAAGSESGRLVVLWTEERDGIDDIWSAQFASPTGWTPSENLEDNPSYTGLPAVAIDDQGRTLAAWSQPEAGELFPRMWTASANDAGSWSAPELIGPSSESRPGVALNASGGGMVAWTWRQMSGAEWEYLVWALIVPSEP